MNIAEYISEILKFISILFIIVEIILINKKKTIDDLSYNLFKKINFIIPMTLVVFLAFNVWVLSSDPMLLYEITSKIFKLLIIAMIVVSFLNKKN